MIKVHYCSVCWSTFKINSKFVIFFTAIAVAQMVEALRYKPEGRGFNFR
jgi:hypothetical protein